MLLEISGLTKTFGGLKAVSDFDIEVAEGEIVGLIGPNGAGKSTVFNLITGVMPVPRVARSSSATWTSLTSSRTRWPRWVSAAPSSSTRCSPSSRSLENVTSSFELHPHSSLVDIFFNTAQYRRNERFVQGDGSRDPGELLGIVRTRPTSLARNLAHGHQKMLGVARALATKPTLLLARRTSGGDEPVGDPAQPRCHPGHARQRHHRAHRGAQHADPQPVRPGGGHQLRSEDLRGAAERGQVQPGSHLRVLWS